MLPHKKVLILDDHAVFSESLKLVLGDAFQVSIASNSNELFDFLAKAEFDLLLLDVNFPDENGLAIYSKLRVLTYSLPVLLITASNSPAIMRDARELGIDGCFLKADHLDSLLEAIQTILKGGEWWPNNPAIHDTDVILKQHGLTARQFDVLKLIDKGCTNSDIAKELFVSESTVKSHVTALYTQLAVKNRTSCLRTARILGLLT